MLTTLAASLSVALENARLFDETQRLLTETNERAAELAIINSVQQGLAAKLEMQSMYDLVGDKLGDIFDAQVIDISIYDLETDRVHAAYVRERGERLFDDWSEHGSMSRMVLDRQQAFVLNDVVAWHQERGMEQVVEVGEPAQSVVFAPLQMGGEVRGHLSLQNLDRTNAFSESDVRLLSTLAGSLSVALENARLFDETQRLLTETNERAAELAIINSVQQGLAEKLEMQAMYELVGEKIQEIFDAQVVAIILYDHEREIARYPYAFEKGERLPEYEAPFAEFSREMFRTRAPILIDNIVQWAEETGSQIAVIEGEAPKSLLTVPLLSGDRVFGGISLQNIDHFAAFSEADRRLLSTLASSLSVALENARLFDETQRLLTETNERAAELAIINSVQQGLAAQARHAVDV